MTESKDRVPEEAVAAALKEDQGPEATLESWQIKDFTKKGDNYACIVTSVAVTFSKGDQVHHKTYVVKISHDTMTSAVMAEMINKSFRKEVLCFLEVLPKINATLGKLELKHIGTARGYYGTCELGKEVLFVEDLRAKGFRMFDRRRGLDKPHAVLVLQELGRLHAASLLMQDTLPNKDIGQTWDCLVEDILKDKEMHKLFSGIIVSQMESVATILEKVDSYGHVIEWIQNNKEKAADIYQASFQFTPKFSVLIHGDCWNNNILFRYDDRGAPVEVMLVDLQIMRYVSAAVDLNYFLFSSFNGPDRKPNLDFYLETYYDAFSHVLKSGQHEVPFTLHELRQEFDRVNIFGCIIGMIITPVMFLESDESIDFITVGEDNLEETTKNNKEKIMRMSKRANTLLRPRLLDMFDEMVEAGCIPK